MSTLIDTTKIEGWQAENLRKGNKRFREYVQSKIALERLETWRKQAIANALNLTQQSKVRSTDCIMLGGNGG